MEKESKVWTQLKVINNNIYLKVTFIAISILILVYFAGLMIGYNWKIIEKLIATF